MGCRRRRKHFSGTREDHVRVGADRVQSLRTEKKILLQHLARGECRAAVNALFHMGVAVGHVGCNRSWAMKGMRRTVKMNTAMRRLAERVGSKCIAKKHR